MRSKRRILLAFAMSLVASSSCVLPAATLLDGPADGGDGGDGSADTDAITSDGAQDASPDTSLDARDSGSNDAVAHADAPFDDASDAQAPPPPSVAIAQAVVALTAVVSQPIGNAGQQHLVYVPGRWWLFYMDNGHVLGRTSATGTGWGAETLVASYTFDPTDSGTLDGREFGVATFQGDGGTFAHFALASGGGTPITHARCPLVGSSVGTCDQASLGDMSTQVDNGAVTSVGSDGVVIDYVQDGTKIIQSSAFRSTTVESGGASWLFGSASAVDLGATTAIRLRSAIELSDGGRFVAWTETQTVFAVERVPGLWTAKETVVSLGSNSFSTCPHGNVGRLLSSSLSGFAFRTLTPGSQPALAPPPQSTAAVAPNGLALVCGPNRVHAFALVSDVVLGASWDPSNGVWSPWSTVVDTSALTTGQHRCGLTAFRQAVNGVAGIAWSETTVCGAPDATQLFAAFPNVVE
jgi:hypothetical protein